LNNPTARYPRGQSTLKVSPEQEAVIRIYADQVGEKIGRLVSEIIVDSLTLLWAEKPTGKQPVVRDQSMSSEQPGIDRLLNAAKVAKRLGISKAKVYQLIERREITAIHMDSAVHVRPQDLEDFIIRSKE
jgi:excisionase family DNA binding protein